MDFLKLNRLKILNIFCLSFSIWSILGLIGYFVLRKRHSTVDYGTTKTLIIFSFVSAAMFFIAYFFNGWYNFYKTRRLLSQVLHLNCFDNNKYSKEYARKKYWIFYTIECVYGTVHGYPTVLLVSTTIAKHAVTTVNFYIFINKFNTVRPELFSCEVENNRVSDEIKTKLMDFISSLINKGYHEGGIENAHEAADMISSL